MNYNNQTQTHFELCQGAGVKMFTLWRVTQSEKRYKRSFVQNLSIDKEQALEKAKTLVGERYEIIDDSVDQLRKIIRSDSGLIHFGKHYGTPVIELPDSYLCWIAKGGVITIEEEKSDNYYTKELASDFQKKLAIQEGLKRNILAEYNGEYHSIKYVEKLLERDRLNALSQYIGKVGEKVSQVVTFEKTSSFDGVYGTTFVNIFRDDKGNVISHLGAFIQGKFTRDFAVNALTGEHINLDSFTNVIDCGVSNGHAHTFDSYQKNAEEKKEYVRTLLEEIKEKNISCCHIIPGDTPIYVNYEDLDEPKYDYSIGGKYLLTGTIKAHSEYRGVKQTQIIRPKLKNIERHDN